MQLGSVVYTTVILLLKQFINLNHAYFLWHVYICAYKRTTVLLIGLISLRLLVCFATTENIEVLNRSKQKPVVAIRLRLF